MGRPDPSVPALELERVVARAGPFRLGPVDLAVVAGEIVAVLGPSGSGKSTLLDVAAGFAAIAEGVVRVAGEEASSTARTVPPERRGVAMLVQEVGLFGHADVRTNVAAAAAGRRPDVDRWLDLVGFAGDRSTPAGRLSGGERKRVGLARVLASPAPLVLLDEPGAHLDAAARRAVAGAVAGALRSAGRAAVVASHELADLFGHAPDALLLLDDGRVLAGERTAELMRRPGSRRVAERLGYESFLDAERDGDGVRCALGRVPADGPLPDGPLAAAWLPGGVRAVPAPDGAAVGRVRQVGWGVAGRVVEVEFGADGDRLRAAAPTPLEGGDAVSLEWTAPAVVSRE